MTRCDKENTIPAPWDFALLLIILFFQILFLALTLHQIEFIHDLQQIVRNDSNSVNKKFVKVCMEGKRLFLAWLSSKSISQPKYEINCIQLLLLVGVMLPGTDLLQICDRLATRIKRATNKFPAHSCEGLMALRNYCFKT